MKKLVLFFIVILGLNQNVSAEYSLNNNCRDAWMLLMDLKISEAKEVLANEIFVNPNNYYAYYLDQTCDAYALLMNSNKEAYYIFLENYEKRRILMDDKDVDSPYYLSCDSEMDLQVGIFNIINGSRFSGLRKAYSSYKKVYQNLKKFPDFEPSLKLDGFFNVAISNLPPFVKWAVSAFGVSGEASYGFKLLLNNYESQKDSRGINAEAALYYVLSTKLNKTPEMAYEFVNSLDSSISVTFLHSYFRANISYRTGKNEEALNSLNVVDISEHPEGDFLYSYLMGKILLRKLDNNSEYYLKRYLSYSKKEEYLKEINYALATHYLAQGNLTDFEKQRKITIEQGVEINERDREASYDAALDYTPNITLTRARLLLDGGYFEDYKTEISKFDLGSNSELAYLLEYYFLEGKYYETTDYKVAISMFKTVIEKGKEKDYYFASEAALRMGNIYEKLGKNEKAKEYCQEAIDLYQDNFYEYIEDKAAKALKSIQ